MKNLKELLKDINITKKELSEDAGKYIKYFNFETKKILAEEKIGLDILVDDDNHVVRNAVAKQGFGLDVLINDEDWRVRYAVAKMGCGLDQLANDEDEAVKELALKMIEEQKEELLKGLDFKDKSVFLGL